MLLIGAKCTQFMGPDWSEGMMIAFLVARGVFSGFFAGAILLYSQAIWLDTIDYDQKRTGLLNSKGY